MTQLIKLFFDRWNDNFQWDTLYKCWVCWFV